MSKLRKLGIIDMYKSYFTIIIDNGDRKAVTRHADMNEDEQQDAIDISTQALEKFSIEKDIANISILILECIE